MTARRPAHPGAATVPRPPYTWAGRQWRPPGSFLTPLIPPVALGLIVLLGHALDFPWWAMAPGSLILFAVATAAAAGERYAQTTTLYMLVLGAYWSLWFGWSSSDYAWRMATVVDGTRQHGGFWWSLAFYAAGLFLTFCLWPSVRRTQIRYESRRYKMRLLTQPAQLLAAPDQLAGVGSDDPRGRQWEALYTALGKKGLTFVEEVENPAGLSVRLRLPLPGVDPDTPALTYAMIATTNGQFQEQLEQRLGDLRPGAIRFERYRNPKTGKLSSLDFWMHIDYEDILAQLVTLPEYTDDELMISINDAFPVGRMADGTYLCLTLREIHAMIVGITRAGKSNLLHIIIHQVSRCYDAAIWMIDLKGGSTARPWLRPWIEGKTSRPLLDWVAIDRWEAARILLSVIDIVTDRAKRRKGSKTEPQREGMPMRTLDPATGQRKIATIDRPAIVLITDELAELVGSHTGPIMADKKGGFTSSFFAGLMTRIATLAAGEAAWGIFAGQRSTADMFGNPSAQKNLGYKIAVGHMDRQDASMVFGNSSPEAVEAVYHLEHKGSIVAWHMGVQRVMPAKAFFAGDDDALDAFCYRAAVRHDGIPATIETDRSGNRLAGEWGYADRWTDPERYGWLLMGDEDLDEEGAVGWDGKPLPLDATNTPIPLSAWREQEQRRTATRTRAEAVPADPTPPVVGSAGDVDAVLDAKLGPAPGGRGFWPQAAPAPAPGTIDAGPAGVEKMLAGFEAYLESPGDTAAAADDEEDTEDSPTGLARKALETAKIIDGYGRTGVSATELAKDMIAAGLITAKGKKGYRRIVKKAMEPGAVLDPQLRVDQPAGPYGRYYTHRNIPVTQ